MITFLVAVVILFSTLFLFLSKKNTRVLTLMPVEERLGTNSNVLGSKSVGQIVFYDSNGVRLGTSLDENFKPQVDITVDDKTTSKTLPSLVSTTKTLGGIGGFLGSSWAKVIEFVSIIFEKIFG